MKSSYYLLILSLMSIYCIGFFNRNYQRRSSPLFSEKTRIEQIEDILLQMAREDRERWARNDEENRKLRKSLNELIGYNQNVDSNFRWGLPSKII